MTKVWSVIAVALILGGMGSAALAVGTTTQSADAVTQPADATTQPAAPEKSAPAETQNENVVPIEAQVAASWAKALSTIGACLGAAIAAAGGGLGVGKIGSSCIESIARQPEAARDMFAPMVVAAGMVEVGMLFAIVVCLMGIMG